MVIARCFERIPGPNCFQSTLRGLTPEAVYPRCRARPPLAWTCLMKSGAAFFATIQTGRTHDAGTPPQMQKGPGKGPCTSVHPQGRRERHPHTLPSIPQCQKGPTDAEGPSKGPSAGARPQGQCGGRGTCLMKTGAALSATFQTWIRN